jgi:hypothetical protein
MTGKRWIRKERRELGEIGRPYTFFISNAAQIIHEKFHFFLVIDSLASHIDNPS